MLSIKLSENEGRAPEAVPYMPAGESWVVATVNGVPGRRRVVATREGCERLQRDLAEHLRASGAREKARPLLMFDHNAKGGAAAVPVGFEWDDERGILLRVEWTQAGRAAVEGGDYGYICPSFLLKKGGDGEILGLTGAVEVGSLVNDPAFERTECIAAGREDEPEAVCVERVEAASALPPQGEGADGGEMVQNVGVPGEVAGAETKKKRDYMEEIAKLLGLPADADSAAICAKISALKSQGANDKKRIEEVEAEKEEHKKALHEHKEKAADAFVERQKKEGKIAPKDEERLAAARAMYLNDAAGAEVIFAGMRRVDGVRETGGADSADKVQGGKAVRDFELLTLEELLAAEG